jgi:hypothetical protein
VLAKCRARCFRKSNRVSPSRFFEEMKARPITVDGATFVPGKCGSQQMDYQPITLEDVKICSGNRIDDS